MSEQLNESSEIGYCDYCDKPYVLGSETDHNPETGNHFECEEENDK